MLVAFEVQHDIDEMFERARTRDCAVLGDVTDQQHRDPARLRERSQSARDGLDLGHAAGHAIDIGGEHRLHRVDDEQRRLTCSTWPKIVARSDSAAR